MTTAQPLLIDPESGLSRSYDQLVADLSRTGVPSSDWPLYPQILEILTQFFSKPPDDLAATDNGRLTPQRSLDFSASLGMAWSAARSGQLKPWQELFQNAPGQLTLATSGTTGQPRRVQHSATTLLRGIQTAAKHRQDVWALTYPLENFAGVQVLFQALLNLNPLVAVAGLPPSKLHAAIHHYGVSHLSGTPTCLRMLIDDRSVQPAIRAVTAGGECLEPELLTRLQKIFPNAVIRNVYASTEAGVVMVARGDIFVVCPELAPKIRIVDGQLLLHRSLLGQFVIESNIGRNDHDYYPTGDLVEVVEGDPVRLKIVGRRNEMLNVGGQKVNPRYVESVLRQLPEIQDAKVYSRRNSVTGDLVCCDLVVASSDTGIEKNLASRLQNQLQPAEIPRLVRVVEQIEYEMTGTGKRIS